MAKRAFLNVYQSRVATALAQAGVSLVIDSVTGLSAQDVLMIDEGNTKAEVVFVTAVSTLTKTATVVRGMAGTTDVAHAKGAIVKKVGWKAIVPVAITDLSSAEEYCILPPKGILVGAHIVLGETIATAPAVVDLYKGATQAITGGKITIAHGSSALGDIGSCVPTLYNEFNGTTDFLRANNLGASANAAPATLILEFICVED